LASDMSGRWMPQLYLPPAARPCVAPPCACAAGARAHCLELRFGDSDFQGITLLCTRQYAKAHEVHKAGMTRGATRRQEARRMAPWRKALSQKHNQPLAQSPQSCANVTCATTLQAPACTYTTAANL